MTLELLIYVILVGAAVYRVGRLIVLDDIFDDQREKAHRWMRRHGKAWNWLSQMLGCPFCCTVWLSLIAMLLVDHDQDLDFTQNVATFLAVCAVSLAWWERIDSEVSGTLNVVLKRPGVEEEL